jgi:phospholipid/cholesterol/gamma-HCH transport system substrate-binding protein
MALQNKKRWAQLKVGLLAISALCILAVLVFLMTSSTGLFTKRSDVYTYLDDSAAIANGAPVRLNGITVGKVANVGLSGSSEPNRIVRVTLEVENRFFTSIPVDSQAAIAAENLLGTKYINIKKGQSPIAVQPGAEIKSLDTREFDEVVPQGYSLLTSLRRSITAESSVASNSVASRADVGCTNIVYRLSAIANAGSSPVSVTNPPGMTS